MATHDYNLANQDGASFRSDLNNALSAIVSNNSSSTAPATTFAHQIWVDTTANVIKQRNAANDAWVELWRIDGGFNAKTFSSNVTLNAQSDLRFADSDSSNWVAFQAPATVSSNVTWTLPSADGSSGEALTTNGSGTLSWASASADVITEGNTSAEVVDTGSDGHFKVVTEGAEALRVDTGQRLLITTDTQRSAVIHTNAKLQLENTSVTRAAAQIVLNSNDANGCGLILGKTRGTSNGSNTSVSSGDTIGNIFFQAADGSELRRSALIKGEVDGTPGSADMPGRLVFATSPDGSAVPAERFRIDSTGAFGIAGANYGTSGQVLTSQGSGSAPQWATPAGGKILQVVHERYSTTATVSCPNNTWSNSGLNASITPSSTNSTVLVYFSLMHDWSANNPAYEGMFNLYRDTTNLAENPSPGTAPGSRNLGLVPGVVTQAGSDNPKQASVSGYSDSPSTTSQVTYKVFARQTVGSTQTLYINRLNSDTNNANYERGVSWITLMEVQG